MRDAVLTGLKAELKSVLKQQADLNREMMRLPVDARRKRWADYYRRTDTLATRRERIEGAAAFLSVKTPPTRSASALSAPADRPPHQGEVGIFFMVAKT